MTVHPSTGGARAAAKCRYPRSTTTHSGPAARQRPGPGTEGVTSRQNEPTTLPRAATSSAPAWERYLFLDPGPKPGKVTGCPVCGDATGVRCCEFGRDR
jgi:hypothetical protein